jgi:hypothetical protein
LAAGVAADPTYGDPRARSTTREIDAEGMSLGIVTVGLDSRVSATCVESLGLRLTGSSLQDQVGVTDLTSGVFEAL